MKSPLLAIALAFFMFTAFEAQAQDGAALTTSKGCVGCHAVAQKKVGPAFKDVAVKYAGKADAGATISAKLKSGQGHPKVAASDAELKSMVDYVLAVK